MSWALIFLVSYFSSALPSSLVNCCPEASTSPTTPSTLCKGSRWDDAAVVVYTRGSVSPFWSPLYGTVTAGTRWAPPSEGGLYIMALLIRALGLPGPTLTLPCFWEVPGAPLLIPGTAPTLTPTAGLKVLFFFLASDRALELSTADGWLVMSDSWRLFGTLGLFCACSLKLLNWSMNSSQCSRWFSGSHVSSLLP